MSVRGLMHAHMRICTRTLSGVAGGSRRAALFGKKSVENGAEKNTMGVAADKNAHGSWAERSIDSSQQARIDGLGKEESQGEGLLFAEKGPQCLRTVLQGFESLREANGTMEIEVVPDLAVKAVFPEKDLVYSVACLPEKSQMALFTPVSGNNSYRFSTERGRWLSVENGHDFEGLLMRDLMRHVYGVPAFKGGW